MALVEFYARPTSMLSFVSRRAQAARNNERKDMWRSLQASLAPAATADTVSNRRQRAAQLPNIDSCQSMIFARLNQREVVKTPEAAEPRDQSGLIFWWQRLRAGKAKSATTLFH